MSLMDNIRGIFSNSKNTQTPPAQVNEEYEKSRLATRIVNLVSEIKSINSFDSSLWNLSNVSSYDLKRKGLDELQRLNTSLENRLSMLTKERSRTAAKSESLEAAKWTGQRPSHMSEHDFDRFQQDEGR